ncbi:MAR-binding filament-like protein 1-1 [Nicotiana tomentosiformis]|uniref:MAR-binding filament-like protein 1-1 n=1 Tax=Nicotiana tomentosiformis TaxID=4098 RepID=UPI00388CA3A5
MEVIKVEAKEWKSKMDCLASKKETSREQLASSEAQLRMMREKSEAQSQRAEKLQSELGSVVADREALSKELKAAKSVVEVTKVDADEMVAQYRAEAARDRLKDIVEYEKCQSQSEALEEIHARGFVLSAEIETAKVLEAEAKKLSYPEEEEKKDSEGSGGSRV